MPKYTYICESCKSIIELIHSMKSNPGPCPKCSNESLVKVYNNFQFNIINKSEEHGKIVNSFIEEAKKDLQQQKEELLNNQNLYKEEKKC